MKFTHMADCHIGSWRDPKLKTLAHAFVKAIDISIKEKVDFILIAGDMFNIISRLDNLEVCSKLRQLRIWEFPCILCQDHDYSASGKTILDVLEEAVIFNVSKVC